MNLSFRDEVFKAGFRPCADVEEFEARLRGKLGLKSKYESARLSIGRSLAEPNPPPPIGIEERGKAIPGELLFGSEMDLWISTIVLDGNLGVHATIDDLRALAEAHWARGGRLLREDLSAVNDDETRLIAHLAELLPSSLGEAGGKSGPQTYFAPASVRLKVGSVSKTYPDGASVDFVLNGPGTAPHIALMGRNASGKTTTGVQIAQQIVEQTGIPFLFIDPKGEFVTDRKLTGIFSELSATPVEVGQQPIPLDFLPDPSVGSVSITNSAMQFRDSVALCCRSVGDIQQRMLWNAVEEIIRHSPTRDLLSIRARYELELQQNNRQLDSVASRLDELTKLRVFAPTIPAREFFSQSWVLSLKTIASEELKRLVILLILDALKWAILSQPETSVESGFRTLRHLLIIDEARRILAQKRYESLVDLIRQGRSKGEVVMFLSQDPSDFEGKADDFMTQLGTVVAFACSQSETGLRALRAPFGRRLQPQEFVDTYLPAGVAFVKLPGREPGRIRCWEPVSGTV